MVFGAGGGNKNDTHDFFKYLFFQLHSIKLVTQTIYESLVYKTLIPFSLYTYYYALDCIMAHKLKWTKDFIVCSRNIGLVQSIQTRNIKGRELYSENISSLKILTFSFTSFQHVDKVHHFKLRKDPKQITIVSKFAAQHNLHFIVLANIYWAKLHFPKIISQTENLDRESKQKYPYCNVVYYR